MSVDINSPICIELFSYVKVYVYPQMFITTWYVSELSIVSFLNKNFFNGLN